MTARKASGAWQGVYALVRRIPEGKVMNYGQIARLLDQSVVGARGRLGHALLPSRHPLASGSQRHGRVLHRSARFPSSGTPKGFAGSRGCPLRALGPGGYEAFPVEPGRGMNLTCAMDSRVGSDPDPGPVDAEAAFVLAGVVGEQKQIVFQQDRCGVPEGPLHHVVPEPAQILPIAHTPLFGPS